jgi:hypothetical protein
MFDFDKFFEAFKPNRPNMKAIKSMFEYEKSVQNKQGSTVYQSSPLQTERNFLFILRVLMWERAKGELNSIAALSEMAPTTNANIMLSTKIRGMISDIDHAISKLPKR